MSMRDEALSMSVHEALSGDKRISSQPIGVRVSNGDVFLKGTVDSLEQRDVAQFIVQGVPGARHVNVDELEVKEGGQ
jgi:osmotically-inducible protein OsmY